MSTRQGGHLFVVGRYLLGRNGSLCLSVRQGGICSRWVLFAGQERILVSVTEPSPTCVQPVLSAACQDDIVGRDQTS